MGRCNTNIHLRNEKSKLKRNKIRPFQAFYTDQCLHRIQKTKMAAGQGEKFCLRWNDFEKNISSSFRELRDDKDFFDVTLACDENQLQAHKVILSACSPFFRSVLKKNPHQHPLLYLKGVKYEEILLVLNFMYHGEVNVAQDELNSFLSVAEDLQVKGLSQSHTKETRTNHHSPNVKRFQDHELSPVSSLPNPRPIKQPRPKTTYDQHQQPPTSSEKFQARREIQEITPQIKTEAPVVLDCDEDPVNTDEIVETSDYHAEHDGYEYDQSYQDQNMMYQSGEMDMGQMGDNTQDPYGHIKQHVLKIPNETGFSCSLCGKKCRDMYLMREHIEALHDMSPGYICNVCSQQCKSHRGLKEHMKRYHKY